MKNNKYRVKILCRLGSLLSLISLVAIPPVIISALNNNLIKVYDETDTTLFNEDSFSEYENEASVNSSVNTIGETFMLKTSDLKNWNVTSGSITFEITKDDIVSNDENFDGEVDIVFAENVEANNLIIPSTVTYQNNEYKITKIKNLIFSGNENLNGSLTLSDNMRQIKDQCFENCTNLFSINIPSTLININFMTFAGCPLTSITIDPDNPFYKKATNVGPDATVIVYNGVKLDKTCSNVVSSLACGDLIISDTTTAISTCAFERCGGLTSVNIGNGVSDISYTAFDNCMNLSAVSFGNKLQTMLYSSSSEGYPFAGCPLTLIEIDIGNPHIGLATNVGEAQVVVKKSTPREIPMLNPNCSNAYGSLACGNLIIPDSVATIIGMDIASEQTVFSSTNIISVAIPDTVTLIGEFSFFDCKNLTKIIIDSPTPPTLNKTAFSGINPDFNIYVPASAIDVYKNAVNWSEYAGKILPIPPKPIDSTNNNLAIIIGCSVGGTVLIGAIIAGIIIYLKKYKKSYKNKK